MSKIPLGFLLASTYNAAHNYLIYTPITILIIYTQSGQFTIHDALLIDPLTLYFSLKKKEKWQCLRNATVKQYGDVSLVGGESGNVYFIRMAH